MTLRTSLFNKGIYKSTIKRFVWGSVVYFVLLFMVTVVMLMALFQQDASHNSLRNEGYIFSTTISGGFLVTIFTVTVTAMLIFRFMHSKKQAIFVHSLPIKRESDFVSVFCAGVTLLVIPIVLNGIAMMFLAYFGNIQDFTISHCFMWIGLMLACVFILFAYSVFSAVITGKTVAIPVLNILILMIPMFVPICIRNISECFLYGYVYDGSVTDSLMRLNPIAWWLTTQSYSAFEDLYQRIFQDALFNIFISLIIYILSFVIYKKRKIENVGNVAGFKCLNCIFKYTVTAFSVMMILAMAFETKSENITEILLITVAISAVIYFAAETLLKRTFAVWNSYKGFLGFLGVFSIIIVVFWYTSFFGFETRVPLSSDVESVSISSRDGLKSTFMPIPFEGNSEIIDYAVEAHKNILSSATAKEKLFAGKNESEQISIVYNLKNGKELKRKYGVNKAQRNGILEELYKYEEYKRSNEDIFNKYIRNIVGIGIGSYPEIKKIDDYKCIDFLDCIQKDILELGYTQIYTESDNIWNLEIIVNYMSKLYENTDNDTMFVDSVTIYINENFKNSVSWLTDNGYASVLPIH